MSLTKIQEKFSQPGVKIYQKDALVFIELENSFGKLALTTQGANLVDYQPADIEGRSARGGVFWVSPSAIYNGSKPLRGGVPVCWPWFGDHPSDASLPAHGFARTQTWDLLEIASDNSFIKLGLKDSPATRELWDFAFELELKVELAEDLTLSLSATNRSDKSMTISEAFHAYFKVADVDKLKILGLKNTRYLDKNLNFSEQEMLTDLEVESPLDWVFIQHKSPVKIQDAGHEIEISKLGSSSTIVWNPGRVGVVEFADIPDRDYKNFICVEVGNALADRYELAAGSSHSLIMKIKV